MKTYICKNCLKTFEVNDKRGATFCSRTCWQSHKQNPINSPRYYRCLFCKKEGIGHRKTQKFCSSKCEINYRYAHGFQASTEAAHESIKINGQPKHRGKPAPWINGPNADAIKKKISKSKKGKQVPKLQGSNHWNWKGGVDKGIWFTLDYKMWRKAVFARDGYTCVKCGDNKGGNLEADHIESRALHPELIYELSNGQTLCKPCHIEKTKKDIVLIRQELPHLVNQYSVLAS